MADWLIFLVILLVILLVIYYLVVFSFLVQNIYEKKEDFIFDLIPFGTLIRTSINNFNKLK